MGRHPQMLKHAKELRLRKAAALPKTVTQSPQDALQNVTEATKPN